MKRQNQQKGTPHSKHVSHLLGMILLPCKKPQEASLSPQLERVSLLPSCLLKDNQLIWAEETIPLPSVGPEEEQGRASSSLAASRTEQKPTQDSSTGQTAKHKRDHLFFVGNMPTLPMGLTASSTSQPTRQALSELEATPCPVPVAKQAALAQRWTSLPRLKRNRVSQVSLIGAGLVTLVLIVLFAQSGLFFHAFGLGKTTNLFSHGSQHVSSQVQSARQPAQSTPAQRQLPTQPIPTSQPSPTQLPTPTSAPSPTLPPSPTQQPVSSVNASQALVRLSQLDPNEYASEREFKIWADSTSSTAALAEVFNAYGRHYRITDVLNVEARLGAITPGRGLLNASGIARTAGQFGFATKWENNWTLNQVLRSANAGRPVIVAWPSDDNPYDHVVVVTGGDAGHVYVADSSAWNLHRVSRAQFMQWWGGFAAVVTPR